MIKKIRIQPLDGLGDLIQEITDSTGISTIVETVANKLNIKDCGCKKRKEKLNNLFPFNKKVEE